MSSVSLASIILKSSSSPALSFGPAPVAYAPIFLEQNLPEVNFRLLSLGERIGLLLSFHSHDFSRPQTSTDTLRRVSYPTGYDSHQHCTQCGVQRFYDARNFIPGPFFVRRIPQPVIAEVA